MNDKTIYVIKDITKESSFCVRTISKVSVIKETDKSYICENDFVIRKSSKVYSVFLEEQDAKIYIKECADKRIAIHKERYYKAISFKQSLEKDGGISLVDKITKRERVDNHTLKK